MKPGELERHLSRLSEVARTARERLDAIERSLTELRHEMETLAAGAHRPETRERGPDEQAEQTADTAGDTAAESGRPTRRAGVTGPAALSGREAGSE